MSASGWQIVYGLNMAMADPAAAASEAAYVERAVGPALLGIEIGNEPDLYHRNGVRSRSYTYADFSQEWLGFARAIREQTPGIALTGPASAADVDGYTVPFARDHAADIVLLTQHYYRGNGQSPTSTLDLLLRPDPNLPRALRTLSAASETNGLKLGYRYAEANSFYHGGAPNISDAHGTALWVLDFMMALALNGASGVNFQGGGNGPGYTPIGDDGHRAVNVRPEFYGMLLFSKLAGCTLLPTRVESGGLNVSGCGAAGTDGSRLLLMVNKEPSRTVRVQTAAGPNAAPARLVRLTGSGISSTSGTLIGGRQIGLDGDWEPTGETVRPEAGIVEFDLPAGSAVLAEFV
jgi:hypothetical protein